MPLGDLPGFEFTRRHDPGERTACLGDIPAPAIGHGDEQLQAAVARGERLGVLHAPHQFAAEVGTVADEAQPHVAAVQILDLTDQSIEEQAHQHAHLIGRSLEILAAEGEQR